MAATAYEKYEHDRSEAGCDLREEYIFERSDNFSGMLALQFDSAKSRSMPDMCDKKSLCFDSVVSLPLGLSSKC
jgi:hypothetical protein